ncbi:MAG TPA: amidohydrolase [Clostridiaceae bacterium]|nr:amidohydrolase [Clostridiaceae bacterium]
MTRILLKNPEAIVSCDREDRVFRNHHLIVENEIIVSITDSIDQDALFDEVIDCSGKVIYPGLINTHHHFFQTFVRNRLSIDYPSMTVIEWLDKIYRVFANFDEEMIYYSSLTAMSDLVKHGCTTAFDHQYCHTKPNGIKMLDQQVKAATEIGIRYVGGRGGNTLPREKGSTIPAPMLETTEEFIADCERLIKTYHDNRPFSMTQIVVAPCQPLNCYSDTFVESVELARKYGVRMHTHLGEGENPLMVERYGMRSLDWCEERGFVGKDVWFAHCWELTPEEFVKLGKYGSGVSHCPAPAVLGGFPILDMRQIRDTGAIISLGCDGSATNDSSNLLDTLRMTYLMQAWHSKVRGGCVTPYDVLLMATRGGAKTLGRPEIGSLESGKAADLFALDLNRLEYVGGLHDIANIIPRMGITEQVDFTMINGKLVFYNGELQLVNEYELKKEADKCQQRINELVD